MNMQRTAGRVAIVTGGAQGIGGATARRLAEEGAHVLIVDIDGVASADNAARIASTGGDADVLLADVGTEDGVRGMVQHAVDRWGRLDILVNNAYAPTGPGAADETADEVWDIGMDVGLKAMFRAAKYAVPHMRTTGAGAIVNIASVHGLLAWRRSVVYETLKTAVLGLTRSLAVDYAPDGIRTNAICPGLIITERSDKTWEGHRDSFAFMERQYPVRRAGAPVDIANAVVFLCSDEASFINGHALVVDGGLTVQLQDDLGVNLAHFIQERPGTWLPW
jgi:meso-butanediol dehydrogenase/(S,S)-butanediol dehydrogenase/diacetyl reductase